MKIFDCTTYFNEPMLFEIRLNVLDKYVDEFIVAEALYTHSGQKKKINFNKELYPKFKDRITHIVIENEPENIVSTDPNSEEISNQSIYRLNAAKRIELQRNSLAQVFDKINYEDWIIYSDSDEIPNLTNLNFREINKKFLLFKQSMFYYKFNLLYPEISWHGSKACKKRDFISPQWLRDLKHKKYPLWRLDMLFSKKKYNTYNIFA